MRRFTERFRTDPEFREWVRKDARAALTVSGISVPPGVSVVYAASAASALGKVLGRRLPMGAANTGAHELDDDALEAVAGGLTLQPDPDAIAAFLSFFKQSRT